MRVHSDLTSPLSGFDGKPSSGTWKLRVADTAALDVGTIGCVTLEITRAQFVCCGVAGTPDIEAGPAVLTTESCPPDNNAIDPGEHVTVNLELHNTGTAATTNLVATLQATGGVTSPSGPQSYGVLTPTGPGSSATRDFTFTAAGVCGGTITATWDLQDGTDQPWDGDQDVRARSDCELNTDVLEPGADHHSGALRAQPPVRPHHTRRLLTSPAWLVRSAR